MMVFLGLLAQTPPDDHVSGKWIIALLVAVIPLVGGVWIKAKQAGKTEVENLRSVRVEDPVPTVPVIKVFPTPTYHQFQALDARVSAVEAEVREFRAALGKQFQHVLEAGADRQERIFEKIDDVARALHARIDLILTIKK